MSKKIRSEKNETILLFLKNYNKCELFLLFLFMRYEVLNSEEFD